MSGASPEVSSLARLRLLASAALHFSAVAQWALKDAARKAWGEGQWESILSNVFNANKADLKHSASVPFQNSVDKIWTEPRHCVTVVSFANKKDFLFDYSEFKHWRISQ